MNINQYKTPIYDMNYSDQKNEFFIKRDDLLPFSFGGNKVRIAEQYFRDMKKKDCDCIIAYGSSRSNLCRVIANMSKSRGIPCYIISSSDDDFSEVSDSYNGILIKKLNANIITCNKNNVAKTVQKVMNICKSNEMKPYYIYGDIYGKGNEKVAVQAYVMAYNEICDYEKTAGFKFDYIFHASGTGITQAGLICGKLICGDKRDIIGISIARSKEIGEKIIAHNIESYFGNDKKGLSNNNIHFEDKYVCGGYGKYNNKIVQIINEVFSLDGIPLDTTYTGKAFWGMTEYLKERGITGAKVLFIHTGGAPLFFDDIRII